MGKIYTAPATPSERLEALETASTRRKYEEARDAAGFDVDGDFNAWRELEALRNLTLAERRAAEEKANPKPKYPSITGGITVNGSLTEFKPSFTIRNTHI